MNYSGENMYDLEIDRVVSEIKSRQAKRILLQLPDGMRPFAFQLLEAIEKSSNALVFLSGDSCYGACDIAITQAEELNTDLVVHYGHSSMINNAKIPVLYVHAKIDIDVDRLIEEALPSLGSYKIVGLATTIQHTHMIDEIREKLTKKGISVIVGKDVNRKMSDAQILGCNYKAVITIKEQVEVFLFIGGGKFHPNGIVMSTGKPVIIANPYTGIISEINEFNLMDIAKRRVAAITIAKNARIFGILVSSKKGQRNLEKALELLKRFKDIGKSAAVIYLDEIRAENLNNYSEPEIFINTACPRIAIDGVNGIERPMLTLNEAEVVLGLRVWECLWGNQYME
jgi:2-(3-amino-3-carboxypropyl)histidine synthase